MLPFKTIFAKGKASKREIVRHKKKSNIKIKRIIEKGVIRNPGKSLGLSVCPKMSCSLPKLCLMGVCLHSSRKREEWKIPCQPIPACLCSYLPRFFLMFNLNHPCCNLSPLLHVLGYLNIKLIPFPLSATFSIFDTFLKSSSEQTPHYFLLLSWYPDH